ncbi:MAG: hypothetical protein J0I19_15365 [Alphaproteobacteria bacterium]|nr:hypothetical protein [Alphaproteobacteria bacterium]
MLSENAIKQLRDELQVIEGRYPKLLEAFVSRKYKTETGAEFAKHGFSRRLSTLKRCIDLVFDWLPPDLRDLPAEYVAKDTTIIIQSFVFNVFGCIDNLAWILVSERNISRADGRALPPSAIGFGTKCETVRSALSGEFCSLLDESKDWFAHLETYRHALAHRIPLYVPPHSVRKGNQKRYIELDGEMTKALIAKDFARRDALEKEQLTLATFDPIYAGSFRENKPPIYFHPQMIVDFKTIEQIAYGALAELDR